MNQYVHTLAATNNIWIIVSCVLKHSTCNPLSFSALNVISLNLIKDLENFSYQTKCRGPALSPTTIAKPQTAYVSYYKANILTPPAALCSQLL